MKNTIIVGGGTAGMLTALFCQKIFPKSKVTLIKSDKIGIIGAGEGSVPNINTFLSFLNIHPLKLMSETKGTIKHGISFENWNNDNDKYFHGFTEDCDFNIQNVFQKNTFGFLLKHLINNKKPFKDNLYSSKLSYENKVDLFNCRFALHFDARLLADYLENIFKDRGGEVIIGEYKDCVLQKNKITKIKLSNNKTYECDFVFDCTGFARLINGKKQEDRFISYSKHLPMKRAIPFFLKNEKDIKPYTQAICMKYGWMWKIPLQHRIGAGYVFDSDFISDKEAMKEIKSLFKKQIIQFNKPISFEAGRLENSWINNCLSVGLSYSFTEPLEATSLYLTIFQLESLLHFVPSLYTLDKSDINLYNKLINDTFDEIVDFLYFHYLTKRKDTTFWKSFKLNNVAPDKLSHIIKRLNKNFTHFDMIKLYRSDNRLFCFESYLKIAEGIGFVTKTSNRYYSIKDLKSYIDSSDIKIKFAKKHKEMLAIVSNNSNQLKK